MTKKHGIVDPWRTVEPVRQAPRPPTPAARTRIDLKDVDRDADLAEPVRCVIRSMHACFDVTSVRVKGPDDALEILAECIGELYQTDAGPALLAANIGIRCRDIMWNAPSEDEAASKLHNAVAVIWFIGKSIDVGMLTLARILRTPAAVPVVRKHGVTVMLTTG